MLGAMLRPAVALFLIAVTAAGPCVAGPPYVTDDPVPTDRGRWEVYAFAAGAHGPDGTGGQAGLDLNYGGPRTCS